jgi:hypothetical protein
MLKVGKIVGSTRPNRFVDTPAKWLVEGAAMRPDYESRERSSSLSG